MQQQECETDSDVVILSVSEESDGVKDFVPRTQIPHPNESGFGMTDNTPFAAY